MRKITPLQWKFYSKWLELNQSYRQTAKALGYYPEQIRQKVASVKRKLRDQEKGN